MATNKESVAKCAGPLRPDGANTMVKTIQYLVEADPSRVLVALDLKAAFQHVSRRAMLFSIEQKRPGSRSCLFQMVHRNHRTQDATPSSAPPVVLIKDVLTQHVVFQRPLILYCGPWWQTHADSVTQVSSSLHTWTTGTCGSTVLVTNICPHCSSHQNSRP